jgi:hypothetical protein
MQLGLSTLESYCDGKPCSYSRSITWKGPLEPAYKLINPAEVFAQITGGYVPGAGDPMAPDPALELQKALNQSVLDAVLESAQRTQMRLGMADREKLERFLESVRSVEQRAGSMGSIIVGARTCEGGTGQAPGLTAEYGLANGQDGYDKGAHMDVMNDLITLAFECDVTRVMSYMMEDERSEFVYSHVAQREFSETGSVEGNGMCGNYHGAQHGGDTNNNFSTINWWQNGKMAELAQKLDAIEDAPGVSMLDNSIIMYASCMHGGNHDGNKLPVVLLGGGGGILKTNQHVAFGEMPNDRPMRDLYYTILNEYFELGVPSFGRHAAGAPNATISEILNT